jgi:hypothetical protein
MIVQKTMALRRRAMSFFGGCAGMIIRYSIALLLCSVAFAQFAGPSSLTPGGSRMVGMRAGGPAGFRYYAGVRGIAEAGLLPAAVDAEGRVIHSQTIYGGALNAGAYGYKSWRRTAVGLNFDVNYRQYSTRSYFHGTNLALALNVEQQITEHTSIAFTNVGGTLSQAFGALYGYVDNPSQLVGVPVNNIFDNRTYFWQTGAVATYQKSARLTFSVGGIGFFIRPQSRLLVGVNGYGGQGNMAYQLSRRSAVFLSYNYYHFDFPRAFGESDSNIMLVGLEHRFSARWNGSVGVGVSHTSTVNVSNIPADPLTAALFGISTVAQVRATSKIYPAAQASLSGRFKRSGVTFSFAQRPNPGNGLYLTSNSRFASATYSYVATRRASLSVGLTYSDLQSVGQRDLGQYRTVSGETGIAYRILESLHATGRVYARRFYIETQSGLSRLGYGAEIGLTFSPGEVPLSFW